MVVLCTHPLQTDSALSIETVLRKTALETTAYFTPMAAGGLVLATVGGMILHLLPGTVLLILSGMGYVACVLLFALIPDDGSGPKYWAWVFPAMICATIGVDVTYNVSNIFITTNMAGNQQGLAGALINSVYFLGVSFFLGIADITASRTANRGLQQSYKGAFWFGTACAIVALALLVGFVKVERARSDLTVDEKAELEAEVVMMTR